MTTLPAEPIVPSIAALQRSFTLFASDRVAELRAQDEKVYNFGLGANPLPPPAALVEELKRYAHRHEYTSVRGIPGLAEAVASRFNGEPEGVVVAPGLKELIYGVQRCFGGTIIHVLPFWVSYAEQTRSSGRETIEITTSFSQECKLLPQQVEEAERKLPGVRKLVIFNHPNNPTGVCYTEEELEALGKAFRAASWIVFADEVYLGNRHQNAPKGRNSIADFYPEGTIRATSLSKEFSGGGWRLGTLLFPKELFWLKEAVTAFGTSTYSCAPVPQQFAARLAFTGSPEISEHLSIQEEIFSMIGHEAYQLVKEKGHPVLEPSAAWYLWVDLEKIGKGLSGNQALAEQLIDRHHFVAVHGSAFGAPADSFFMRLSLVDFDGEQALSLVRSGCKDPKQLAPHLFEGLDVAL